MATYVEQGAAAPTGVHPAVLSYHGVVVYTLTSGANGTQLTGTGEYIIINSDTSGWLHVSDSANTDKAASTKTHRITADVQRDIGGVRKGMWVSFLADA